ncbi:MAG: FecR domain-containing protein [Myxococcota bacterium]
MDEVMQMLRQEQDRRLARDSVVAEASALAIVELTRRSAVPPRRRARWPLVAAAVVLVGAGVVSWGWRSSSPLAYDVQGSDTSVAGWIAAGDTGSEIEFEDGTQVSLEPQSEARLVSVSPVGAVLSLERGALAMNVQHRPEGQWTVLAGPYAVVVEGTVFRVTRAIGGVGVNVERGVVRVDGHCRDAGVKLRAGEAAQFRCGQASRDARAAVPAPLVTAQREDTAEDESGPVDQTREGGRRGVRETSPVRAQEDRDESGDALVEAARQLALTGDVPAARRLLRRARRTRSRALAAFLLGKLAFDEDQNFGEAVRWFRTCLREQPGGPLAREAQGRVVEALALAGRDREAHAAARRYLERFPRGPHATRARALLDGP